MKDLASNQRGEYTEWLRTRKKSNGEHYSENTIMSYATSLATAPGKLTGIELETTNIYQITSAEVFKKERALMLEASNFQEVNEKAGNRAFQYALEYYEEFLTLKEEGNLPNPVMEKESSAGNTTNTMDKNIILNGPPGTGKTYHTVIYAVAIIENTSLEAIKYEIENGNYHDVLERYHTYKENGQIEFTTFHQSYGYEEFIEGIKPKMDMDSENENNGDVSYEIQAGIFKQFCERARTPIVRDQNKYGIREQPTIWKVSLGGARENPIKRDCFDNNRIRIGWDDYGEIITEETDFSISGGKHVLSRFIDEMMIGDIVLVLHDQRTIDGIGVITGEYEWLGDLENYKRSRSVNWLAKDIRESIYELNGNKVLVAESVYKLNRINYADVLERLQHYDTTLSSDIEQNRDNYVFVIDEINRGNISKIFGELITLIEPSKRMGQAEEIKLKLPYSLEEFGVPDNVYLLATMNTADRSIARMDTALRRRFDYVEMLPDPSLLDDINIEGINIARLLKIMNDRIEILFDREHMIGHAYFIPLKSNPTLSSLANIFQNAIIPLLQEYFYEDYHSIQLILGDHNKDRHEQFIQDENVDLTKLFGNASVLDIDEVNSYRINHDAFTNINAYIKIYDM